MQKETEIMALMDLYRERVILFNFPVPGRYY